MNNNERIVRAGPREWLGLAVLSLPTLLLALDFTMLHLALPHLAADLDPSSAQQLWILDIYGFMIAGFLITMGTLGDRIGRRKLLLIGAAAFGAASVLAAFSASAEMLIVARALLGITGATLMPSTLGLIGNMFKDPKQRASAIAVWMVCFSVGGMIGPAVGGFLLEYYWWGSVFLLGVPVMLLLLATGPWLLPEYRNTASKKLDFVSVLLSFAALLPLIYGVKNMAKAGLDFDLASMAAVAAGLIAGYVFVKRQRKLNEPLLDLGLFGYRGFSASLIMLLLCMMIMGGFVLLFAQYLQLVEGLSPVEAGLWMIPYAVGGTIGILATPALARRFRSSPLIVSGLTIAAIGYLLAIWTDSPWGIAVPVVGSVLMTLGVGPLQILSMDLIIGSAPPDKAGAASALSETSGELGMAMGIAAMGSIGTIVYRSRMEVSFPMPEEAAMSAKDTLAGAIAAAERLPNSLSEELQRSAREAFASGYQIVGITSVVLFLAIAAIALVSLRYERPKVQSDISSL